MKGIAVMEMGTIIPIVLALLIFFGSLVSAMNTVNQKNRRIDLVFSLIQIVDRVTEAGVITKKNFNEVQSVLKETIPVNYYICVTTYDDDQYSRCGTGRGLVAAKQDDLKYKSPQQIVGSLSGEYVSAAFPVTYQVTKDGVPFNEVNRMLVIVWQGA